MSKTKRDYTELIKQVTTFADNIPGLVIIYDREDDHVTYISERTQLAMGISYAEAKEMQAHFYDLFADCLASEKDMLQQLRNIASGDEGSFFVKVKQPNQQWVWHLCTPTNIRQGHERTPLVLLLLQPVVVKGPYQQKISRLIDEQKFKLAHTPQFNKLGKREMEVLRWVVLGHTSKELGQQMGISESTVETHRRNIKAKLEAGSTYDLIRYAKAFDLLG